MVKKIFKLLSKEISGLHEAAYLLGGFALLSQILGLIRDRSLAHFFGAENILDIYYASFRIPDFIFITIASMVSISVLIPFLSDRIIEEKQEAQNFINSIFNAFFATMVFVSTILFFTVPFLIPKLFPGFKPDSIIETIKLTKILLLSPFFLGLSNLFGSIVQLNKKFIVYAISPILYNAGIIFGIFFLYPVLGIQGLAWGVILGALTHLLIQVVSATQSGLAPKFSFTIDWVEVKKVFLLSLPRTLTMSANQIAFFILVSLASTIGDGAISIFNFSFNLQSVPLGIIGVSYSVAAFPTLARLFSNGETEKFLNQIVSATRHIIFWSMPAIILFIILRAQIVRVILGTGKFDWTDTKLTAASLAIFAFSITAQSLILLFTRGYYAAGKTKKPLMINLACSSLIIFFVFQFNNLFISIDSFRFFLESIFRVENLAGTKVLILALSYSIGSIINSLLFVFFYNKDFGEFSSQISKTFWDSLSASIIMGFVTYHSLNIFGKILDLETLQGIFLQGLGSGVIGIICGTVVLILLNNQELQEIKNSLTAKILKAQVILPEKREL